MAELTHSPDSKRSTGDYPGPPRWVKVFGIVVLALILVVVLVMVTGIGGEHGPGRHMRSGGAGGGTPRPVGVQRP